MELEIKEKHNDNNIIVDYHGKEFEFESAFNDEYDIKPERELTADGLPTVKQQLIDMEQSDREHVEKYTKDELKHYNREMIQRVKCLALYKMGKSVLLNTYDMKPKDKKVLQELMWEYNDIDHKLIIQEFNDKIGDEIFGLENDMSKMPIYDYKC